MKLLKTLKVLKILLTGTIGFWLFYLVGYGGTLDIFEMTLLGFIFIISAIDDISRFRNQETNHDSRNS